MDADPQTINVTFKSCRASSAAIADADDCVEDSPENFFVPNATIKCKLDTGDKSDSNGEHNMPIAGAFGTAIVPDNMATVVDVDVWAISSEHNNNNNIVGKDNSSKDSNSEYSSDNDNDEGSDTNSQQSQPSQSSSGHQGPLRLYLELKICYWILLAKTRLPKSPTDCTMTKQLDEDMETDTKITCDASMDYNENMTEVPRELGVQPMAEKAVLIEDATPIKLAGTATDMQTTMKDVVATTPMHADQPIMHSIPLPATPVTSEPPIALSLDSNEETIDEAITEITDVTDDPEYSMVEVEPLVFKHTGSLLLDAPHVTSADTGPAEAITEITDPEPGTSVQHITEVTVVRYGHKHRF
ncbi:hypothetical protein H4R24_003427 [Coemansia sp. RSA 988]|nr:hypothetical protein H4R24_003427 [Coemansia sp. RSA 988]